MNRLAAALALTFALVAGDAIADVSAADRSAVLAAAQRPANARGQVMNDCEERVAPTFRTVDIEGLGEVVLMVVPGGPHSATCYGDGPGLVHLVRPTSAGMKVIFADRGYVGVLSTSTRGVRDIALGGPGFSFPVFRWNGTEYEPADRTVSDSVFGEGPSYP